MADRGKYLDRHLRAGEMIRRHKFTPAIVARVRQLHVLDNHHGVLALLGDYIVIAACILVSEQVGWLIYPLAVVIIGSRQRAFATLTHEAAHQTLARNRPLNDLLGTYFSGYLILMLLQAYRESHVKNHHGNFGHLEKDGDYSYMIAMGVYSQLPRWRYVLNVLVSPLLLFKLPSYVGYLARDRLLAWNSPQGRLELVRLMILWCVMLLCLFMTGYLSQFLLYWVVPFFTAYQIIGWYIELSEHAPLMASELDVRMSRNRNSHWLERALTAIHGEAYHLAHHLWPRVPFWRMAELNKILREDPVYRDQDDRCGGILISNNGAPSVISLLSHKSRFSKNPVNLTN